MILKVIIIQAKEAKGCKSNEADHSPIINNFIALPKPQPGHHVKPKYPTGQMVECSTAKGSIHKIPINPKIQKNNSQGTLK